jgi:ssDNA-specific exonuclease RecJ
MTKAEKYQEIISQTTEWFDDKLEQLQSLIDKKSDSKIFFKNDDGEKIELPDDLKKGFFFGLQIAIEVFREFPIKITKTNNSN